MKGWLMANLFITGMSMFAAAFMFSTVFAVRLTGVSAETERTIVGFLAMLALVVAGLCFRALIRRLERRR